MSLDASPNARPFVMTTMLVAKCPVRPPLPTSSAHFQLENEAEDRLTPWFLPHHASPFTPSPPSHTGDKYLRARALILLLVRLLLLDHFLIISGLKSNRIIGSHAEFQRWSGEFDVEVEIEMGDPLVLPHPQSTGRRS